MSKKNEIIKTLMTMATLYDKAMNEAAAEMLISDLDGFSDEAILAALKKCRMELGRFPSVHDIISRAQSSDGRPGTEEAWSLCPKNESVSAYVNDEIMCAFMAANSILQESNDHIAARLCFREVYEGAVKMNRSKNIAPRWFLSSGTDPKGREVALREAIEKNRLLPETAQKLLPQINFVKKDQKQISDSNDQATQIKMLVSTMFKEMPN